MVESTPSGASSCNVLTFTCKVINADGSVRTDANFPDSSNQRKIFINRSSAFTANGVRISCDDQNSQNYLSNAFNIVVSNCDSKISGENFKANIAIGIDKSNPTSTKTLFTTTSVKNTNYFVTTDSTNCPINSYSLETTPSTASIVSTGGKVRITRGGATKFTETGLRVVVSAG